MDITGIPPHTTLLAKTQSLKCIIEYFIVSITREIKGLLKYEFDARDIYGTGFVQANKHFPSLVKSSLTIRSQQSRALVKEKSSFYILLNTKFLLRTIF